MQTFRSPWGIQLPGILQSQKFGNFGDEISTKTPWVLSLYDRFWYLREDYKAYTSNRARSRCRFFRSRRVTISVPPGISATYKSNPSSSGRRVVLTLERPHWETTVWLDGQKIGSDKSLVAPHVYDLGAVTPGRHRLTIRVDNRMIMPYRPDAHSVSDSLGSQLERHRRQD